MIAIIEGLIYMTIGALMVFLIVKVVKTFGGE